MIRFQALLFLALGLWLTSCSFIPGSTVRVALPAGDPRAQALWSAVLKALPPSAGAVPVETVSAEAFPPADLIWFDGNTDNPVYQAQALGTNAQVDTLAKESGLPAGWFGVEGDRILPLAWSPWAWWTAPGKTAPALGGHPLVPYADPADLNALVLATGRIQGPTLGGDQTSAVWAVWGHAARDEGKSLSAAQALTLWDENRHDRIWLKWADLSSASGAPELAPEAAPAVPTRVIGFWWNTAGWNRDRVPGLLARLWTRETQAVWVKEPGWLPASGLVPVEERARMVQALGKATKTLVVTGN